MTTIGRLRRLSASALLAGFLTGLCLRAEEGAPPEAQAPKTAGLEIDVKKLEVRADATVCLDAGILEYLACLPDTFEHEALFRVRCKPSELHLGLLLIGLKPCPIDPLGLWRRKARDTSRSRVRIEVEYEQEGKKQRLGLSRLLVNRRQRSAAVPDAWVFTGSFFGRRGDRRVYAADVAGGVIGLGQDDASVLQLGEDLGNPYQGDEQGLEVDTNTVPAKGTPVQLIVTPHRPEAREKPEPGAAGAEIPPG